LPQGWRRQWAVSSRFFHAHAPRRPSDRVTETSITQPAPEPPREWPNEEGVPVPLDVEDAAP
jgi:hypothetical protein